MTYREPTVGALIEQLSEFPPHYLATVIVGGTVGVITGVWCQPIDRHGRDAPHVLIGEHEVAPATVPAEWIREKS